MPPKFKRTDPNETSQAERRNLLAPNSDEEDFFVSNDAAGSSQNGSRVQRLQGQVSDVVAVMQDNIGKVLDRGDKLSDLQDKSESLSSSADSFRIRARDVRSTMWWRECKMKLALAVVLLLILAIIIIPIIIKYNK